MKRTTPPKRPKPYKPGGSPGQRARRVQAARERQGDRTLQGQLAQFIANLIR